MAKKKKEAAAAWVDADDLPPLPDATPDDDAKTYVYIHPACKGVAFELGYMPPEGAVLPRVATCEACGKALGPLSVRHVKSA